MKMKRINKWLAMLLAVVMVLSFAACGQEPAPAPQPEPTTDVTYPVTVKDMAGREVTLEKQPERIVSGYYISSSACIALGLTDKMVGIEDKSTKRPIYKLAAPALIDLPNVGSAKAFDLEACIATEPDLVILPMKQKDTAQTLQEMGIATLLVLPESHEQLIEMFTLIGTATNTVKQAEKLISYYNTKLSAVTELTRDIPDDEKPVVYLGSTGDILRTAPREMYQASLITTAGGKNAGDVLEGSSWTDIDNETFLTMNPDIIVIPTDNFAVSSPDYTAEDVMNNPTFSDVTAVKNGAVYQMPVGYEAWDSPVPSGILGTLWMLKTLHPELYPAEQFAADVNEFYTVFYGFSVNEQDLRD
jgi:iron complex transport system substrate-binding protein